MGTMEVKEEQASKQLKELNVKLQAMETRVLTATNQYQGLERKKEEIQKEMQQKMDLHNQAVDKSITESKAKILELSLLRDKMKEERASLDQQVIAVRQEKQAFEKEKEDALNMKNNAAANLKRVENFMKVVREQVQYL